MGNSYFQDYHSKIIKDIFSELELQDEMPVGKKRVDLGTLDYRYGIEIKSGHGDLKSGCGLNQCKFSYGYIICPEKLVPYAIGYLYLKGMQETGVIGIDDNNNYLMFKPASFNTHTMESMSSHEFVWNGLSGGMDEISRKIRRNSNKS